MKSNKKGFAPLMEWAGADRWYIYVSIVLSFISGICAIIPYFAFYRIIDAVVLNICSLDFALKWAAIILTSTAVRVCCNLFASLSSHRGAYNTLFKVRCMVTEHMAKIPLVLVAVVMVFMFGRFSRFMPQVNEAGGHLFGSVKGQYPHRRRRCERD